MRAALRCAEERFAALERQVSVVLEGLDILPLEKPVDEVYGLLRCSLETKGRPIGANDLLIAAQAVAYGHVLVTDNEREFGRIEELAVENWLRD